jgi:HEPN domain-containing protein
MKKLTREWVRKAEADYRGARRLVPSRPPVHDLVCFCCQQCAEKYLKGLLEEDGLIVPRTHNLEDLLDRLVTAYPELNSLRRGCKYLMRFAIDARYPGFRTTKRQSASALRWSERIRQEARKLLGVS